MPFTVRPSSPGRLRTDVAWSYRIEVENPATRQRVVLYQRDRAERLLSDGWRLVAAVGTTIR